MSGETQGPIFDDVKAALEGLQKLMSRLAVGLSRRKVTASSLFTTTL